jgi:hypothetical protein
MSNQVSNPTAYAPRATQARVFKDPDTGRQLLPWELDLADWLAGYPDIAFQQAHGRAVHLLSVASAMLDGEPVDPDVAASYSQAELQAAKDQMRQIRGDAPTGAGSEARHG